MDSSASSNTEREEVPAGVKRCLGLWRSAKSDNERLAALLLVAKLFKSGELSDNTRKRIFESIGFTFINRLLATGTGDEGELSFKQVAIAVLSCYCTNEEMALHPQVTSKIPTLIELLTAENSPQPLITDCLACVQGIASSHKGRHHLWRSDMLGTLSKCYIQQRDEVQVMVQQLVLLLVSDSILTLKYPAFVLSALQILSSKFNSTHDKLKFDLCALMTNVLLVAVDAIHAVSDTWLADVAGGLYDILQSKLDAEHRNTALCLAGVICQLYGCQWTLLNAQREKRKFICFASPKEVQLLVDGQLWSELESHHTSLLSGCLSVMENSVVFLANCTENSSGNILTEEDQLQLHTTLMEGFSSLIHFLHSVTQQQEQQGQQDSTYSHEFLVSPLLLAVVRTLGSWMAEDSLALSSTVLLLLPFLVKLCHHNEDVMKFILPGITHLLAEEKPRELLVSAGFIKELVHHFIRLQEMIKKSDKDMIISLKDQLCLCCSAGQTLCVSDPNIVCEHGALIAEWVESLLPLISQRTFIESPVLCLHSTLLYLLLLRRQDCHQFPSSHNLSSMMHQVLLLLSDSLSHFTRKGDIGMWAELKELWHLAIHELSAIASCSPDTQQSMLQSPSLNKMKQCADSLATTLDRSEEHQSVVSSLLVLASSLNSKPS